MSNFTDPDYLRSTQYKDSSNLGARIQLHERFTITNVDLHHWMFDLMLASFPAHARILEIGCGRGDLWWKNADRIPEGWDIVLSDLSSGMLEDTQKHLGDTASRIRFEVVDVRDIPYEDHYFDGVAANFMLYHVPDRTKAIVELRRVLKPDGCLHTITLGKNHLREYKEMAKQRFNALGFELRNGVEQLRQQFADVMCIKYESALEVTELQPLVDYYLSWNNEDLDETAFRTLGQSALEEQGNIHITKEIGALISRGYADEAIK